MNKGFSTPILFIPAFLIILFSLLIYAIFVMSTNAGSQAIKPIDLQINDVNDNLQVYLESPVKSGNETISMAELIGLWHYDKGYDGLLSINTERIFKRLYGNCYYLSIDENDAAIKSFGVYTESSDFRQTISIPLYEGELKISLNPSNYYAINNLGVCGLNE